MGKSKKRNYFVMWCSDDTEGECLKRKLFGEKDKYLPQLQPIEKGDIGFLWNFSARKLLGVFVAQGPARLNIVPEAWEGRFPAQIRVRLLGKLEELDFGSKPFQLYKEYEKIKKLMDMGNLAPGKFPHAPPEVPSRKILPRANGRKVFHMFGY